ncbi:MAG TPA: DUF4345 family protein [Xanthomonadaceae bacterium]|nr:DUF4345 family protein [Xanthomonadaceae bacterium]
MANWLPIATLWIAGLGFLGFGIALLVAPLPVMDWVGLQVSGAGADIEIRAFYGGLEIGLGLLLLYAAVNPAWRGFGLWLCVAAFGGLAGARAIGLLLAGGGPRMLWFAWLTELVVLVLAVVSLRLRRP